MIKPSLVGPSRCIYSAAVADDTGGYGIGEAWDQNGNPENAANAHLMAAAPAMYAVLQEIAAGEFNCSRHQFFMAAQGRAEDVLAAIAKATSSPAQVPGDKSREDHSKAEASQS